MPFGLGIWEIVVVLVLLLLVFGPKRLPEMGRQLGKGMREFKDSVTGDHDDDTVLPPAEPAPVQAAAPAQPAAPAQAAEPVAPAQPAAPAEPAVPAAPAAPESREQETAS